MSLKLEEFQNVNDKTWKSSEWWEQVWEFLPAGLFGFSVEKCIQTQVKFWTMGTVANWFQVLVDSTAVL